LLLAVGVLVSSSPASAADIRGTISSPLVITEDSQLVGDVTCTVTGVSCIAFGASGISLKLNGFSVTGNADAVTGCAGGGAGITEIGIDVNNQRGVIIQGPGIVQHFRGHGIRLLDSTRVLVRSVTLSTNCFAGIIVTRGSDNDLEENIAVRNGNVANPCGGI
jgi:parallel beta-helix repeat protein